MKIFNKNEWKKVKLEDIFKEVISGEWGEDVLNVDEEGTFVIRNTNFKNDGKLDIVNKEIVKRKIDIKKIEEKKLKINDIIIEKSGGSPNQPVGRVVYFNINSDKNFLCNNFTSILRVKEGIDPRFIFYFLRQCYRSKKVLKFQNKTTGIINLKLKDYLNNLTILLPDIEKQKKISKLLDLLSSLIENRKEQLKYLKELNKSLFTRMFGKPLVNDNKKFKFKKIAEIGEVVSGSTPKTNIDEYWNGENYWITPAEITDKNIYINSSIRKISEKGIISCSLKKMPKNTVILSSRAPIGKVGILTNEMYCNQGFKNIIPTSEINSLYLFFILKESTEYLNSLGRGATFKEISKKVVENIEIKIPPIELQNKFAERVEKIEKLSFETLFFNTSNHKREVA